MRNFIFITCMLFYCIVSDAQERIDLFSPSKEIKVSVGTNRGKLEYSVCFKDRPILRDMPLSMTFDNGFIAGEGIKSFRCKTFSKNDIFEPDIAVRNSSVRLSYNETELHFNKYSIIFRIYEDAVCYRFQTRFGNRPVKVLEEKVGYHFAQDYHILFPKERSMHTHQECKYIENKVSGIKDGEFCSPPLLAFADNIRILLTEVDLESYPGIYYKKNGDLNFSGQFPYFPEKTLKISDRNMKITQYADYMANTSGDRRYPWRVALITDRDTGLLNSSTLYSLASPSRIGDVSWIKCGKVAWDWWNNLTLTGVGFKSGVNTETYKYFIDFAAKNGLEYILLDEGWYDIRKGVLDIVKDIDLKEIADYGKEKNVGVILWVTWLALEENMEEAFSRYHDMGIKGFKIDFMQRDDQWMVDWYYSTTRKAAEYHMLVDYHGAYKPTGLTRTFPNMLTSEGVYGAEQNKWSYGLTPDHNVTLPFTRMALGPMDYTPGAMRNSKKGEFIPRYSTPMSQGTRCHQLGMYVVYESPLQMLSDSPTNYEKEPDMMAFLSKVPTLWDETKALSASLGRFLIIARRNGNQWWLGGMCGWKGHLEEISLDFLSEGKNYEMTIWKDGINIQKNAEDYKMEKKLVKKGEKITVDMAEGGGFAANFKIIE